MNGTIIAINRINGMYAVQIEDGGDQGIVVHSEILFPALGELAFFWGAARGVIARIAGGAFVDGLGGWRQRGGFLRRAIGAAQDCPINIGAQVFAANGAIGDALNIRTAISRNWPMTTKPLTRKRRMHTQGFSQGSATAKNGNRLLYGCYMFAHKANTSDAI